MANLIKQPNGKYCSTDFCGRAYYVNYTEEDIINLYIENANKDMEKALHFGELIKCMESGKRLKAERIITDKTIKSMGFNAPYNELVKFIAREPLDEQYAPCDFTSYAKCPNCNNTVRNGMGWVDEKCGKCGQLLKW